MADLAPKNRTKSRTVKDHKACEFPETGTLFLGGLRESQMSGQKVRNSGIHLAASVARPASGRAEPES